MINDRPDVLGEYLANLERVPEIFRRSWDAIAIYDLTGRMVTGNAAARALVGGERADALVGQHYAAHLDPAEAAFASREFALVATTGEARDGITAFRAVDGSRIPVSVRLVPARVDGQIAGVVGFARETRRRERVSAREARRVAELYRIAANFTILPDDKVTTALDIGLHELHFDWAYVGRVQDGTLELEHTAGGGPGSFATGTRIALADAAVRFAIQDDDLFVAEDMARAGFVFSDNRATWKSFAGCPLTVDGVQYGAIGFSASSRRLRLSQTDREYLRALAALIGSAVQQRLHDKRLDELAFHDALTGLPNRALLHDRLEQALLSARRHRRSFAAFYIDIDHFKTINDTYGHDVGDAVLIAVSGWLRESLRDSDTIARFGGDEFVVLQHEIDARSQAEELATKLAGIRARRFHFGDQEIGVTVSVGGAVFPGDAADPAGMLRAADAALYAVKKRGRDGFAVGAATERR